MIELRNNKFVTGYTLIEIIISLILGSLLVIAITSLYIYTNNLNKLALEKLNYEQDITFLNNIISKDASIAGNFECLSLGNINAPDSINNDNTFNNLFYINYKDNILPPLATDRPDSKFNNIIPKTNESFGVFVTTTDNLKNLNGLTLKKDSPVLVFFYGTGSTGINKINISNNNKLQFISFNDYSDINYTNKSGGFLTLSSCKALNIFKGNKNDNLYFTAKDFGDIDMLNQKINRSQYDLQRVNHHLENEISLSKLNVIAYFLAKENNDNENNLYRLEMGYDGFWTNPEIMLKNVVDMDVSFLYTTGFHNGIPIGCTSTFELGLQDKASFNNYSIVRDKNHVYGYNNFKIAPASLDIKLKVNNIQNSTNKIENTKQAYDEIQITAVIRGGNTCANRKLIN